MKADDINQKITEASEWYSNTTIIRMAVAGIPGVGGSLSELFGSRASKIAEKRFLDFVEATKREMEAVNESKIDQNFLDSDEFYDLVAKAFDQSVKTRSHKKRVLYAKILRSRISSAAADTETAEDYMNIVTELTETEVIIARELYRRMISDPHTQAGTQYYWASRRGLQELFSEGLIPEADYDYVLIRLQRVGLLRELTGGFTTYGADDYSTYMMTNTFKKLMAFVDSAPPQLSR